MPRARCWTGVALSLFIACAGCRQPQPAAGPRPLDDAVARAFERALRQSGEHAPGDLLDRLLVGEVMRHSEFTPNLRALAMPGGRLSGTPNADRAGEFVAQKLRAYGLQNVHGEPFDLESWIVRSTKVTILGDAPRELTGAVALGKTISTPPGGIVAEVVDIGDGGPEDFTAHAAALRGRFALARDNNNRRTDKMQHALEAGAAGLLVMSRPERDPVIGNGHRTPHAEPGVVIPHDEELLAQLARGATVRVRVELETENWHCRPQNIVGDIPGQGPLADEIVLIGAHLDSWHLGEGAIDNGNGSACILETARALAAVGAPSRRTIRFVWFMAEELMLEGSRAYAAQHDSEMDRLVAMVNVDMPGAPRKFYHFGHKEIEPLLQDVIAALPGYGLSPDIDDASWDASDHAPFMYAGVCCLGLSGDLGPGVKNYHTAGDKFETVDCRGTVQSSAVLAVLARHLADAPARPTVRLPPRPMKPF
jgi:carboxypeptidase Q